MYDGNCADAPTFGARTVLAISARQADDLAYAVVKAVVENFADFRRLHPALQLLEKKGMVAERGGYADPSRSAEVLPGALRYCREVGLLR